MNLLLMFSGLVTLAAGPAPIPGPHPVQGVDGLSYTIDLTTVVEDFDGETCWFHPRAGSSTCRTTSPG